MMMLQPSRAEADHSKYVEDLILRPTPLGTLAGRPLAVVANRDERMFEDQGGEGWDAAEPSWALSLSRTARTICVGG